MRVLRWLAWFAFAANAHQCGVLILRRLAIRKYPAPDVDFDELWKGVTDAC